MCIVPAAGPLLREILYQRPQTQNSAFGLLYRSPDAQTGLLLSENFFVILLTV